MARTYRTDYAWNKNAARDGKVRKWAAPGFVRAEEKAAKKARRQQGREVVEAQLEEYLDQVEWEEAQEEAAWWVEQMEEHERREMEFWAEEERIRQQILESGDMEALYEFDNPAYAKWKERKMLREMEEEGRLVLA